MMSRFLARPDDLHVDTTLTTIKFTLCTSLHVYFTQGSS